jgi:hypothetical protein
LVEEIMRKRFQEAISKKKYDLDDVEAAREYTEAMLHFVLSSHHLFKYLTSGGTH